jgi:hypothetical protein
VVNLGNKPAEMRTSKTLRQIYTIGQQNIEIHKKHKVNNSEEETESRRRQVAEDGLLHSFLSIGYQGLFPWGQS